MESISVNISQLVNNLNNVNLDEEIAVFEVEYDGVSTESPLTRFDALIVMLCLEGCIELNVDTRRYSLSKNSILVLQSQNYISFTSSLPGSRALVLACSHHIVEEALPKLSDLRPMMLKQRTSPVAHLSDSEAKKISEFITFLKSYISRPSSPYVKRAVVCLLQSSLYLLLDSELKSLQSSNPSPAPSSRKDEIFTKFLILVSENFRHERQVSWYADQLCITPKHLSTVVKSISGRTAGEWIENYVVMEAKVLLRTTDLTIQQIADQLNFVNQSFFGKYFKHITGKSPSLFRKT